MWDQGPLDLPGHLQLACHGEILLLHGGLLIRKLCVQPTFLDDRCKLARNLLKKRHVVLGVGSLVDAGKVDKPYWLALHDRADR